MEKGKETIIRKLRTIQLIEADLQCLMRTFISRRVEENIENDERMPQHDYGSRRNYSIENVIVEKWLMCDLAIRDGKEVIYNLSDLEACYDY